MDRKERASDMKRSDYANTREVSAGDARTLPDGSARGDNRGADPGTIAADEIDRPTGGTPRSEVTGRHDTGSGANETPDGLSGIEEMTREAAEDIAPRTRYDETRETPVFDRGERIRRG
jgi:hypothetical protein